jgi:hypothetical protein
MEPSKNMDAKQKFSLIWKKNKPLLYSGQVLTTEFENGRQSNLEYILSLVVVLERQREDLIDHIVAIQNKFKEAAPTQYYYPESSFHITVAGCTPFYKQRSEISDERVAKINNICADIIKNWSVPIFLTIRGVNVITSSIFLQVFSPNNSYGMLRNKILSELQLIGEEPIMQLDTNEIHMNIVKFTNRELAEIRGMVSLASKMRDINLDEFRVKEIELDITDRIQSPETTAIVGRFSLPNV